MQRYFALINGGEAVLSKEDAHHLIDAARTKAKEKIEIVAEGGVYLAQVSSLSPLTIAVISKIEEKRDADNEIILAFSLLKGDHNDLVVEKGTELGASAFVPFLCTRTIVKVEPGSEDGRLLRLRKIAKESSQQCRRGSIPEVSSYRTFSDVLTLEAPIRILAYEELAGENQTLLEAMSGLEKNQKVLILVGPEGGFTPEEAQKAKKAGFRFVSLGRRILRAETASIASLALISAFSEANR